MTRYARFIVEVEVTDDDEARRLTQEIERELFRFDADVTYSDTVER